MLALYPLDQALTVDFQNIDSETPDRRVGGVDQQGAAVLDGGRHRIRRPRVPAAAPRVRRRIPIRPSPAAARSIRCPTARGASQRRPPRLQAAWGAARNSPQSTCSSRDSRPDSTPAAGDRLEHGFSALAFSQPADADTGRTRQGDQPLTAGFGLALQPLPEGGRRNFHLARQPVCAWPMRRIVCRRSTNADLSASDARFVLRPLPYDSSNCPIFPHSLVVTIFPPGFRPSLATILRSALPQANLLNSSRPEREVGFR